MTLNVNWIHGSANCNTNTDPPIQVHEINPTTFILRQNACLDFEAPFMFLLIGGDKAFMLDTGATQSAALFPIRDTIEGLLNTWLTAQGRTRDSLELIVAHTHSHGDHVQGDGQFNGQPNTTLVGTSSNAVEGFFGINDWPDEIVTYDLGGGRILDVFGIPGHQAQSIAVFDRDTTILFTGDTFYPGNIFVSSWSQLQDSIARLTAFAVLNPPTMILGTHIEMTSTPGVVYPYPNVYQPDEHVLELQLDHLIELNDTLSQTGSAQCLYFDDFLVNPGGC